MGTKKNFVLDTNVILHDYNCLKNFQENDIYLPLVVLEELDKFKKGNEQINFNAREFVRGNRIPDRQVSENEIYLGDQRCESAHESSFNRSALRRLYYG